MFCFADPAPQNRQPNNWQQKDLELTALLDFWSTKNWKFMCFSFPCTHAKSKCNNERLHWIIKSQGFVDVRFSHMLVERLCWTAHCQVWAAWQQIDLIFSCHCAALHWHFLGQWNLHPLSWPLSVLSRACAFFHLFVSFVFQFPSRGWPQDWRTADCTAKNNLKKLDKNIEWWILTDAMIFFWSVCIADSGWSKKCNCFCTLNMIDAKADKMWPVSASSWLQHAQVSTFLTLFLLFNIDNENQTTCIDAVVLILKIRTISWNQPNKNDCGDSCLLLQDMHEAKMFGLRVRECLPGSTPTLTKLVLTGDLNRANRCWPVLTGANWC